MGAKSNEKVTMSYQREFEKRLRLGVVGVGGHSYRNILPALHYLPVEVVALCDRNPAVLPRTAAEMGVKATYTDTGRMYAEAALDAVLIVVGERQHPDLAIQAMRAGVHVWMEKPPAVYARDVRRMVEARGDRVCAVGYKKAFMPATQKAKELMTLPGFGSLLNLVGIYPLSIPSDGMAGLERKGFVPWMNACHPLSLMIELGGPVKTVTTVRGSSMPGQPQETVGAVLLQYASGATGTFPLCGGLAGGIPMEQYHLFGSKGQVISIENSAKVSYHRGTPLPYGVATDFTGGGSTTESGTVSWEASHMLATLECDKLFLQGMYQSLMEFCQAILEKRALRSGHLEMALHLMEIYEAALKSQGDAVTIPT
jgi:predicted dehydrogenase